jgi:hypothetical protein
VAEICGKIQDGTGRKIGDMIQNGTQFVFSYAAAFYLSWKLTLVLVAAFPLIGGSGEKHHSLKLFMADVYVSTCRLLLH